MTFSSPVAAAEFSKFAGILSAALLQHHLLGLKYLTCLLRNLYTAVRTGHGTTDWFQIGKGVRQGCIFSPCLFNFYAEYIMRNAGLEEVHAGIKLPGEISTSDT